MDLQGSEISRVWYGAEISRVCYENRDFAALLKNVKARNPQTVRMDAAAAGCHREYPMPTRIACSQSKAEAPSSYS